jgi:hypothetical protein
MKRLLSSAAYAAALLLCSVSVDAISGPAYAQRDFEIGFNSFHNRLANYGDWVYSDRWGEVWIPADVPDDFRPYDTGGYWAYTDEYGWYWASNYEWGDIPFHYGRWVNDPDDGWLWIPGYEWSPAWVVWRSNGDYTGWMAMPPDEAFLGRNSSGLAEGGVGISINFNDVSGFYGYSRWYGHDYDRDRFATNWVFVPTGHMADRDYHRYVAPRERIVTIINNTSNITNYTVVNNYVVNRSVDVHLVQRAGGHPVVAVHAANVIRDPQLVLRADAGRTIQMRVRAENPHGNGLANSAPSPSPTIVQSLSTNLRAHRISAATGTGQSPRHLFTRTTIGSAPLASGRGALGNMPGPGLSGAGPGGANNAGGNGSTATGAQGPTEKHHHANGGEALGTGAGTTSTSTGNAMPGGSTVTVDSMKHRQGSTSAPNDLSGATMNLPSEQTRHRHHDNGGMGSGAGNAPSGGTSSGMTNITNDLRRHRHEDNSGGATGSGGNAMTPVVQPHATQPAANGDNGPSDQKHHKGNSGNPHDNGAPNADHDKKPNPQ